MKGLATHIAQNLCTSDAEMQSLLMGAICVEYSTLWTRGGFDVILVHFLFFTLLFRNGIRCFLAGCSCQLWEPRTGCTGWRSHRSESQQEASWVSVCSLRVRVLLFWGRCVCEVYFWGSFALLKEWSALWWGNLPTSGQRSFLVPSGVLYPVVLLCSGMLYANHTH